MTLATDGKHWPGQQNAEPEKHEKEKNSTGRHEASGN